MRLKQSCLPGARQFGDLAKWQERGSKQRLSPKCHIMPRQQWRIMFPEVDRQLKRNDSRRGLESFGGKNLWRISALGSFRINGSHGAGPGGIARKRRHRDDHHRPRDPMASTIFASVSTVGELRAERLQIVRPVGYTEMLLGGSTETPDRRGRSHQDRRPDVGVVYLLFRGCCSYRPSAAVTRGFVARTGGQ